MSGSGRLKNAPSNRSFMPARRKRRRHAQNSTLGKDIRRSAEGKKSHRQGREPRHGDQGALVDKDVADAAFSLKKEGEVSAPVKAQFRHRDRPGWQDRSIDRQALSRSCRGAQTGYRLQRAQKDIDRIHDAIEDQRYRRKIACGSSGRAPGSNPRSSPRLMRPAMIRRVRPVKDLVDSQALLKAAFASDVGVDNDTLRVKGGGYQWFEVTKVDKPRDKAFDEAKADVEKAWRDEEAGKILLAKTADLTKKLDAGEPLRPLRRRKASLKSSMRKMSCATVGLGSRSMS